MELQEAKRYYQDYCGSSFFMDHDDPSKHNEFRSLSISDDTKREWLEELADSLLNKYDPSSKDDWYCLTRLHTVLDNRLCPKKPYLERLLLCLNNGILDPHHRVIVLEGFLGTTASRKDGLLHLCRRECPELLPEMKKTILSLASFTDEERKDDRIEKAVQAVKKTTW
ncbi:MAG: hypothetical protein IIZ33_09325 [Erysipelotrichaceae bacterium]|nr:hypothetical protein [Erysipelotrichaceae bacterium]